jgi:hypothetical protein
MLNNRFYILLLFLIGLAATGYSQKVVADSSSIFEGEIEHIDHKDLEELHSPKKATILSAVFPGAGQIYNKKYWKLPIIWGGIATSLYLSQVNRDLYQEFRTEYILELGYPDTQSKYHGQATIASLESTKNEYKKWMETSYIVAGVIYVLQILDANVDAQLMTFDVSDDLSFNVVPGAYPNLVKPSPTMGVTLSLNFK